ncbi:MAG TPA: hypothetical protein PKN87_04810 [Syntrophomonadaceae bacterium]|nr:hypothetical protein [Syntrophomonadaceae bacterium]
MSNQKLLRAIEEQRKPFLKQTLIYSDIDQETINLVKNDFPEYDSIEELPLLFCMGYTESFQLRWFFISNKRLYYRLASFPPILTALDCIDLHRIKSLKIHSRWVVNYIELNGRKIGTIIISSIREILFLKKFINIILKNYEHREPDEISETLKIDYYPTCEWKHLDNAGVFPLVNNYFSKHNQGGRLWGYYHFYTNPFINPEKISLARQEYADYDPKEEIPLLLVENLGEKTSGIVITNKYVYYNLSPTIMKNEMKNKIALDKLKSFRIKSRYFGWIYINNQKKGMTSAFDFLDRKAAIIFQELVNLIIEEVTRQ